VESLDHIVGLLSEVSFIPIYDGMPDYLTALNEYVKRDFRVSAFYNEVRVPPALPGWQ
jgi:hypothetical protein